MKKLRSILQQVRKLDYGQKMVKLDHPLIFIRKKLSNYMLRLFRSMFL